MIRGAEVVRKCRFIWLQTGAELAYIGIQCSGWGQSRLSRMIELGMQSFDRDITRKGAPVDRDLKQAFI